MKSEKPVRALRLPPDYAAWLTALKERVRSVQLKAATRVNRELILLYWDIGRSIVEAQRDRGYGKQVVERLAADLQEEFPGLAGFSPLNVWRMRAFYEAYAGAGRILSQAVTELASAAEVAQPRRLALGQKLSQPVTELAGTIVQQAVAQLSSSLTPAELSIVSQRAGRLDASPPEPLASLPWGHNLLLLHKLKSRTDRFWYAQAAVEHGWSRSVLGMQIEQRAHRRAGRAVTNFAATLPREEPADGRVRPARPEETHRCRRVAHPPGRVAAQEASRQPAHRGGDRGGTGRQSASEEGSPMNTAKASRPKRL